MVKLVVVADQVVSDFSDLQVCSGAQVCDLLSETFIGDDKRPAPGVPGSSGNLEALSQEQAQLDAWDTYHFPYLHDEASSGEGITRHLSRPYLAALVLGATGWSGYRDEQGYWSCKFADLTEAGAALYRQIEQAYPNTTLHLLTFLDT